MLIDCNITSFQNRFKDNLAQMLSPDELGSFILVLANCMQDAQLEQSLKPKIEETFKALINNQSLTSSPDDLAVFNAIKQTGVSHYHAWKISHIKDWQFVYNPFRALRPARTSNESFKGLSLPFNNAAFHFSKPFLKPEIISEEVFDGTPLQVMYHKFPFVPYHLLIVIEAAKLRPQFMDKHTHKLSCKLVSHTTKQIDNFGLSYNSLGAGASINQLHLHGFINPSFSIEKPNWTHNGGHTQYPLNVTRCNSTAESWQLIKECHKQQQPYNLLYRANICYVIQRKPQNEIEFPEWLSSISWFEACGGFHLNDERLLLDINNDAIIHALSLLNDH